MCIIKNKFNININNAGAGQAINKGDLKFNEAHK